MLINIRHFLPLTSFRSRHQPHRKVNRRLRGNLFYHGKVMLCSDSSAAVYVCNYTTFSPSYPN